MIARRGMDSLFSKKIRAMRMFLDSGANYTGCNATGAAYRQIIVATFCSVFGRKRGIHNTIRNAS